MDVGAQLPIDSPTTTRGGADPAGRLRRLLPGGDSASWSVVDQGLFGASNLLSSLILARWLPPEQYGALATALAVLFLAGVVHSALFVEPMLVLGVRRGERQNEYLSLLTTGHGPFGAVALAVCGGAALILQAGGRPDAAGVVGALGVALPCVLGAWLTRRICYLRGAPDKAARASAATLPLVAGGLAVAMLIDRLSAAVALLVMAAAGALVSAWLVRTLRLRAWPQIGRADRRDLLGEHWRLSRWLLLVVPFEWVPGNYYYLALPAIGGLAEPALLRASMNIVQPLMQIFAALRLALTPRLAAAASRADAERLAWRSVAVMIGVAAAWYALLFFAGGPLCDLLYGGAYPEAGRILRVLGLLPVCFALATVASGLLRARERARQELVAAVAAAVVSLLVGLPMMLAHGALGAAWAAVVAFAVFAAARIALLARR